MRTTHKKFIHEISGSGNETGAVPTANQLIDGVTGSLVGFDARLSVGAAVTTVTAYSWDGQHAAGATVPDENRTFESDEVASPTADATVGFIHQRFDPEPFSDGQTPAVDVAATGAWTIIVTLLVELVG